MCKNTREGGVTRHKQLNDSTDIATMGEVVCDLADHEVKEPMLSEVIQNKDLTALGTLVETRVWKTIPIWIQRKTWLTNPTRKRNMGTIEHSILGQRNGRRNTQTLEKVAINMERMVTTEENVALKEKAINKSQE